MRDNISDQEIGAGLWWLKNKKLLKKILTIALLAVCAIIIVNLIYLLIAYFVQMPKTNNFLEDLSKDNIQYIDMRQSIAPVDLEIVTQGAVGNRTGEFDLYAKVKNNNANWAAVDCSYYYIVSGVQTNPKNTFFIPSEEKYLLDFAFESLETTKASSLSIDLMIEGCEWQRVNDPSLLVQTEFLIEDIEIKQGTLVDESFSRSSENSNLNVDIYGFPTTNANSRVTGTSLTQLSLDLINRSIYGFWEVGVSVVLTYQGEVIGVNYLSLDRLLSFEGRSLVFNWPKYFSRTSDPEIFIEVNVLDEGNLIGLGE